MVLSGTIRRGLRCIMPMGAIIMGMRIIGIIVTDTTIMRTAMHIIMVITMAGRFIAIRITGQCRTFNAER